MVSVWAEPEVGNVFNALKDNSHYAALKLSLNIRLFCGEMLTD